MINDMPALMEALLFAAGQPLDLGDTAAVLETDITEINAALDELETKYAAPGSGLMLLRYSDKAQLCVSDRLKDTVAAVLDPPKKQSLSNAALETLAIIAYRQPITRAEVEQLRGVQCDYIINNLLQRGMIEEAGKKDTLGRPTLFRTTDDFLRRFALKSIEDLPDIKLFSAETEEEGE